MAQVIVRNLDDAVVSRLKEIAKSENKSLEQKLREILADAGRASKSELKKRALEIIRQTKATALDSVDLIREDRDR